MNSMRNVWWGLILIISVHCTNARAVELDLNSIPENSFEMNQVRFWARVFSEFGSDDRIVHNANDLNQIYLVARGSKLSSKELVANAIAGSGSKAVLSPRIQVGQRDRIQTGFQISKKYLKRMREIFAEEHVPEDLTLLSFIESGFVANAKSKAGATGLWQMMNSSSRGKLKVTDWVDERLDPLKSARGAAKLLNDYFKILGSWPLAIMAYHHGVGTVQRAIKRHKTKDPFELIRLNKDSKFGFASRNYLFEFYAMLQVAKVKRELFTAEDLPAFITVSFSKPVSLRTIKVIFKTNEKDFETANPHFLKPVLSSKKLIPAYYPIRLPNIGLDEFKELSNKAGIH